MIDTERQTVLSVRDLDIDFWVDGTWYPAVIDASFDLNAGEVLAIVGESGSGKSTTAMALLGLLPKNASLRGSIKLGGRDDRGSGIPSRNSPRARRESGGPPTSSSSSCDLRWR